MKTFPGLFVLALLLTGCGPAPAPRVTTAPVESIASPAVLPATSSLSEDPPPSPTDVQHPFTPGTSADEYCKPPSAIFPVEDGNDISENEIVHALLNIWLRRFIQPDTPPICRIDAYSIDNVDDDPGVYSKALEPRGDFMRTVTFSVKLSRVPSDWMGFSGELDSANWLHVTHAVAVIRAGDGYKMEFAYP